MRLEAGSTYVDLTSKELAALLGSGVVIACFRDAPLHYHIAGGRTWSDVKQVIRRRVSTYNRTVRSTTNGY